MNASLLLSNSSDVQRIPTRLD